MSNSQQKAEFEQSSPQISRRKVLQGAALLAASLSVNRGMAAEEHDHAAMGGYNALVESALHCTRDGNACMHHLLVLASNGDTSLAECAHGVTDMLAICDALVTFASHNSAHLLGVAAVAATISDDCEAVCRNHADAHEECRKLADSCAACARECRAIAA